MFGAQAPDVRIQTKPLVRLLRSLDMNQHIAVPPKTLGGQHQAVQQKEYEDSWRIVITRGD